MSVVLIVFFALCSLAPVHGAEGAQIEKTVFLPQDYYVGDIVELRVSFVPDGGMRISSPSELPVLSWIEFHEVSLIESEGNPQVRIRFSSFAPGTRTLPPLRLGDVQLDSIKIHTKSILNERSIDFVDIKSQLLVPGTRLTIVVFVALLFFGPILVFSFAGRLTQGFSSLLAAQRGKRPYKRLDRVLKDMEEKQEQMSSRKFYIVLEEEFRSYLSSRTGADFQAITSSEFADYFLEIFPEGAEKNAHSVYRFLRRSDLVKFGGENADKIRREGDMRIVGEAASEVERIEEDRRKTERENRRGGRKRK